jgi:hypothetical protein
MFLGDFLDAIVNYYTLGTTRPCLAFIGDILVG